MYGSSRNLAAAEVIAVGSASHQRRRSHGDTATGWGSLDLDLRHETPNEHGLARRRLKPANRRRAMRAWPTMVMGGSGGGANEAGNGER
jgi:hypothetical protein